MRGTLSPPPSIRASSESEWRGESTDMQVRPRSGARDRETQAHAGVYTCRSPFAAAEREIVRFSIGFASIAFRGDGAVLFAFAGALADFASCSNSA